MNNYFKSVGKKASKAFNNKINNHTIAQLSSESNINYNNIDLDSKMRENSVYSALKNLGYH